MLRGRVRNPWTPSRESSCMNSRLIETQKNELAVRWTGLPIRSEGPIFGGEINQIDGRVFDVRIGVRVCEIFCELPFQSRIRRRRLRMRPQIVAKEQRITLVGSPLDAHVSIRATPPYRRDEKPLHPVCVGTVCVGRAMVTAPYDARSCISEVAHCGLC